MQIFMSKDYHVLSIKVVSHIFMLNKKLSKLRNKDALIQVID